MEEELGFRLPPSYRWCLVHYGNARLDGANILMIAPPEHREYDDTDLLYIHRLNKPEGWWASQFPYILYYFDTSSRGEQGEFSIMCYDLMKGLIDTYASSFSEFLERLIDERS